ncbi:helix-turn-helix transcriptional regulator [Natrarchaeobaculum sulfurireducens]|uniref:helix-turn-helix transcriptional regulator n=1 Tax=Natrarchaeobaculum sulfurireducens TaxID=2044521 RepID=UPI000E3E6994|nr:winged helix-turn-helix domain-containing protein [Natrarchaeobaculum sulfurireducens]
MAGREETIDDKQILDYIERSPDPVTTTAEIADNFGFSNTGILKRLHPMRDDGYLKSKEAGRTYVWWITDRGRACLADETGNEEKYY